MFRLYRIYRAKLQQACKYFFCGSKYRGILLLAGILSLFGEMASAAEMRCGWLENPSPANLWLTDADASWTLSTQGGEQLDDDSLNNMPNTDVAEFVATNGGYGYSCACLKVRVDKKQQRIIQVLSGKNLPLKQCLQDRALPRMDK